MTDPANAETKPDTFYEREPYVEAFDIVYPQENLEGEMYKYRCKYCKRLTTDINGRIENHAEDCEYRRSKQQAANAG